MKHFLSVRKSMNWSSKCLKLSVEAVPVWSSVSHFHVIQPSKTNNLHRNCHTRNGEDKFDAICRYAFEWLEFVITFLCLVVQENNLMVSYEWMWAIFQQNLSKVWVIQRFADMCFSLQNDCVLREKYYCSVLSESDTHGPNNVYLSHCDNDS